MGWGSNASVLGVCSCERAIASMGATLLIDMIDMYSFRVAWSSFASSSISNSSFPWSHEPGLVFDWFSSVAAR